MSETGPEGFGAEQAGETGGDESWGQLAKDAGRELARSAATTLVSWLVFGGLALGGLWLASSTSNTFANMGRVSWLGAAVAAVGAGGFVGFWSLMEVLAVFRGELRGSSVAPDRWLRALGPVVGMLLAVYFLFRAVTG